MSPRYATVRDHNHAIKLVIKDPLSADRTILANERTFLAYIRTAVTLLVAGLSLISFFPSNLVKFIGILSLVPTIIIFSVGARRYYYLKHSLNS
jgi:putative membrane protein